MVDQGQHCQLDMPVLRVYIVLNRRLIRVYILSLCSPAQILRVKILYLMQAA